MNLAGEDGVAAFGVIMYVNFIFVAVFMGYSVGSAPIVSYHYGAGNDAELHNLYRKSKNILIVAGIVLTIAAEMNLKDIIFSNKKLLKIEKKLRI